MKTIEEKEKKGFLLYSDLNYTLKKLTMEQAGELFNMILDYVNDKTPETEDVLLDIIFEPIKQQLNRDLDKWEKICEARKKAGAEGGKASVKARQNKKDKELKKEEEKQKKAEPNLPIQAIGSFASNNEENQSFQNESNKETIPTLQANQPDNDIGIDSKIDIDNKIETVIKEKEKNILEINQDIIKKEKMADEYLFEDLSELVASYRNGISVRSDEKNSLKLILEIILDEMVKKGELKKDNHFIYKSFRKLIDYCNEEFRCEDLNFIHNNWNIVIEGMALNKKKEENMSYIYNRAS